MKLLVCGDLSISARVPGLTLDKYPRGDSGGSERKSFKVFAAMEWVDFSVLANVVLHTLEFSIDSSADLISVPGGKHQQYVTRL